MENYVIVTDKTGGRIVNENGLTLIQNVAGNLVSIFSEIIFNQLLFYLTRLVD